MTGVTAPIRFGLIGVDSPHAPSFITLFSDGHTGAVPGGTITAAWKAPTSLDFPPSANRNDDFARTVAELGVPVLDSPALVDAAVDAFLVVASDSRTHPDLVHALLGFGKPIFVDTRFAPARAQAQAMLAAAQAADVLLLAGSPKRFTPEFRGALGRGRVESIALHGALPEQPGHPGLSWYGVHLVDLAVAALGPGCVRVDARSERITLHWADGRSASLGGPPEWDAHTVGTVRADGVERSFDIVAEEAMLVGILGSVVASVRSGTANVPPVEILETVSIIESANAALAERGVRTVPLGGAIA